MMIIIKLKHELVFVVGGILPQNPYSTTINITKFGSLVQTVDGLRPNKSKIMNL